MQVGGPAERLLTAESARDVEESARGIGPSEPLWVLGGGSNVIVSDEGVPGIVLQLGMSGVSEVRAGDSVLLKVEAGTVWHDFVEQTVRAGLAGLECLGGIPGKVGATPLQNVGAYGQEVSDTISSVTVFDKNTFEQLEFRGEDCGFSYRHSRFKDAGGRYIILAVTYRLTKGGAPQIRYGELSKALEAKHAAPSLLQVFETVIALRRTKSMVLDPSDENGRSCGSFFVNAQVSPESVERISVIEGEAPPQFPAEGGLTKIPSAWLIERAGLKKGLRQGPVGLSTKHTLSLVAHEGARALDIVRFARHVRRVVEEKYGVRLIPEPQFWGFSALEAGLPSLEITPPSGQGFRI